MNDFQYLLRKHTNALGLFAKVRNRLLKLEGEINDLLKRSQGQIEEATITIEKEKQALAALNTHLTDVQRSRTDVERFLPQGQTA